MIYQESAQELAINESPPATIGAHLPSGLALLEQATAILRAHLRGVGLEHYAIYHSFALDLDDVDRHLPRLDPQAAWQPLPLLPGCEQPVALDVDDDRTKTAPVGVLHLPRHHFVLARWHWVNFENSRLDLTLAAAPDAAAHARLHQAVVALRRSTGQPVWEIIRNGYTQETRPRTPMAWDELLLAPAVKNRLEAEITGFFSQPVGELYRTMGVPYRRGVLMHGPPGNGKTSIIRALGANLPDVYAMILRPTHTINDEQLKQVFRRWRAHAPAILVIEDLDHLLKDYINLSHFLNQVDGIEGSLTGGLLLIGTTNHPDKLDPAINNRPGRFDVVIEIPPPDAAQRAQFFQKAFAPLPREVVETVVSETAELSFSHLHEVVRLSGLVAIHDRAAARGPEHVLRAARLVAEGHRAARLGFPISSETPFGLAQFRKKA
jgi:hypothetical protein